jgi:DNA replication protein DnaC
VAPSECLACSEISATEKTREIEMYAHRQADAAIEASKIPRRFAKGTLRQVYHAKAGMKVATAKAQAGDLLVYSAFNQAAFEALEDWPPGWFALFGGVGTGKTALATAAMVDRCHASAVKAIRHTIQVYTWGGAWTTEHGFYRDLRSEFDGNDRSHFDLYATASPLVLDDLGAGRTERTGWELEQLEALIDARYAADLSTLITTNLDIDGVEALVGERVASRLRDVCAFVEVRGPDWRRIS